MPFALRWMSTMDVVVGALTLAGAAGFWLAVLDRFFGMTGANLLAAFVLTIQGALGIWLGNALGARRWSVWRMQYVWVGTGVLAIPLALRQEDYAWTASELVGSGLHVVTLVPLLHPRVRALLRRLASRR